ncbi:hypothetical protein ACFV9G_05500 [Nocardioides sp. NPDC059952]|uniref:hypothetical protein n=1 Tax=Nocardioides sp. NPDC059952 TaxID=3347014 RepID=UPI00365B1A88
MSVPPPSPYDPWVGLQDPAFKVAVDAGDWAAARVSLEAFPADRLIAAFACLKDVEEAEVWLEKALADDPADFVAKTALAARYIVVGWTIRSSRRAENVSREQFEQFHGWLTSAEELLTEVCAEHPDYAPAWHYRLVTARGLQLGQAEARRRYDKLAAIAAHHFDAQGAYLQQIVPKWGGSWEMAEEFAAECREAAPLGSPSRALLLDVLIERWMDNSVRPDVTRLPEIAAETVGHPDHQESAWGAAVHSQLAMLYSLAARPKLAAPHFQALDAVPSRDGWSYLQEGSYERSRESAFDPHASDDPHRTVAIGNLVLLLPLFVVCALVALGSAAMTVLYGIQKGDFAGTAGWAAVAAVAGLLSWLSFRPVRRNWHNL